MHIYEMLDEFDDMIYIADIETYELLFLNASARRILKSDALKGRKCYEVLQGKKAPCEFCTNEKLTRDAFYNWEYTNVKLGRHLLVKDKLIFWEGRKARLEFAVDITEKEKERQRLQSELRIESTMMECIHAFEDEKDLGRAVDRIMEYLGRFHMADRAYAFAFEGSVEGGMFKARHTHEWCAGNVEPQLERVRSIPLSEMARWKETFAKQGAIIIGALSRELDTASVEYQLLQEQGAESLMVVPLTSGGEVIGCMGVDNPRYAAGDASFLKSVAYFIKSHMEKQAVKAHLELLSFTDPLTGIGNRNKYISVLQEMQQAGGSGFGVVYIDVNGLKVANDTYGHNFGDRIIVNVADILRGIFKENVFRTGGDEYVVLCRNLTREEFDGLTARMRSIFAERRDCQVSCGAAWKQSGEDLDALIRYADELMYVEKQSYYKSNLGKRTLHHSSIMEETLRSLENGEFVVYLQPQILLGTGELGGAEALIRKRSPSGELISPDKFIPLLEAELLIRHIDFFVLREVCTKLAEWKRQGRALLPIAINLSRITLMEHGIVKKLAEVCAAHHIPHQYIDIEITESVGIMSEESLRLISEDILAAGFALSLDDFGSKYCNLSMLTDISFTSVKFDKSLVDTICKSSRSRAIIKHCIDMCSDFNNVHTVAEGIETEAQASLLKMYNCHYGQGYYFSKPVSIAEFTRKWLAS